jgi:hypothetical protein
MYDSHPPTTLTKEEEFQQRRKEMLRTLDRYSPRREMITREDLDELGIEYDGDDLYVPKP